MKTMIYFKENGCLAKFEAEGVLSHADAVRMLRQHRVKVKGAVMLTYQEAAQ